MTVPHNVVNQEYIDAVSYLYVLSEKVYTVTFFEEAQGLKIYFTKIRNKLLKMEFLFLRGKILVE